ncbi:MAG: Gfo/Idh/MocA family oxidoreductase [Oscillospiraceae bacterium]|jgi:predicted dehydrogenase|nr:Gfo/Idh/MocA family oxidoreductase [Oscillospiraceae bacterium]
MLNIGIAGCGSIARQRHASEYARNEAARIAGFFDLNAGRAQALADSSIGAVSVCVANKSHADYAIAALNAGKHVLCEKPMAISLSECEAMTQAAQKNGRRLLIGQNQRLAPAHAYAKRILASGEMGRVLSFQSVFGHKGPESWSVDQSADTWFFKKEFAAFGSMADLGIHKIDLLLYLVGKEPESVYASLMTLDKTFPDGRPIEVDDNSVVMLRFAGGPAGTVTTSWTHYGEECNSTVLYCEKGIVKMYADPRYALQIVYADGVRANYELPAMQTNDDAQQTGSGVIDTFLEGITSGCPTILDAPDILRSMRVVFACLDSASSGRPVSIL